MNILVAIGIYAFLFGVWGEEYLPTANAKYGIMVDSTAESIGLRNGDKILAVDGKPVPRFNKIVAEFIFNEAKSFTVEREGQQLNVPIPEGTIRKVIKSQRATFIQPRVPVVVADVSEKSEAERMGLKANDSIISVNGQNIRFVDEFEKAKRAAVGKPIALTVLRNNVLVSLQGTVPESKVIGFAWKSPDAFFATDKIKYGPFAAIGKGFTHTFDQVGNYWRQLKMIFTSKEIKASESLGGIISFGKIFSPVFDWQDFLMLTAFVSIILAVMNLLPIPGLDGGYVLFLLFELVSGRKVSDKVMEKATTVGLVLLLGLMLYANGLDIFRLFSK
jgi:regulator of sigma E protease